MFLLKLSSRELGVQRGRFPCMGSIYILKVSSHFKDTTHRKSDDGIENPFSPVSGKGLSCLDLEQNTMLFVCSISIQTTLLGRPLDSDTEAIFGSKLPTNYYKYNALISCKLP